MAKFHRIFEFLAFSWTEAVHLKSSAERKKGIALSSTQKTSEKDMQRAFAVIGNLDALISSRKREIERKKLLKIRAVCFKTFGEILK